MRSRLPRKVIIGAAIAFAGLVAFDLSGINAFEKEYRLRLWEKGRFDGDCAYMEGNLEIARQKYRNSAEHAGRLDKNSFREGTSLANLASAWAGTGDLQRAKEYYRAGLNALDKVHYPESDSVDSQLLEEDIIYTLNRLGGVLLKLNAGPSAVPYFERALKMTERLMARSSLVQNDRTLSGEMVESLTGLGTVNFDARDYRQARILYERALAIASSTLVPDSLQHRVRVNLAVTLQQTGKGKNLTGLIDSKAWREAIQKANEAMAARDFVTAEKELRIAVAALAAAGPDDVRTADTLASLGEACYLNGKFDQSIEFYKQAMKISARLVSTYERRDDAIARKLAYSLLARGDYDQLETVLKEQLSKRQGQFGISHPMCAEIQANLCLLYLRTGRLQSMREIAPGALKVLLNSDRPKPRYARALRDLSVCLSHDSNYKSAIVALEKAREILQFKQTEARVLNARLCEIEIARNQMNMGEPSLALASLSATMAGLQSDRRSLVSAAMLAEALKLQLAILKAQGKTADSASVEKKLTGLGKTVPLFKDFWCDEPDKIIS